MFITGGIILYLSYNCLQLHSLSKKEVRGILTTIILFWSNFAYCNSINEQMEKTPKVIVFDLDYTLWPFWVDTHVDPPFRKGAQNKVIDVHGHAVRCYADVPDVLKQLSEKGYELGIASRTSEIKGAKQLIDLFGWKKYFKYVEIFPGSKVTHFSNIQKSSQADYKDMLFFDDEARNIIEVGKLGVHAILVRDGVTHHVVEGALQSFTKQ